MRKLLAVFQIDATPLVIYCDNQAAISLIKNANGTSARTKHIDVQHHFVRERVARGEVDFLYCKTEDQAADIFTKALLTIKFEACKRMLGMP